MTVEAGIAILTAVIGLNTFATKALVRGELARLNGRYVQSPIFKANHDALSDKLEGLKTYQEEHFLDVKERIVTVSKEMGEARAERANVIERVIKLEAASNAQRLDRLEAK